jgi:hypothetical protein
MPSILYRALEYRAARLEDAVTLDLMKERGTPLDEQAFDWGDLVRAPISKLNDDAFTRARVQLMVALESEAVRFQHACARSCAHLRRPLARVRRVEHHQQTLVHWLMPPDMSPVETSIGLEQTVVEVTAALAEREPDAYLAQVYRFAMLEDFDHIYRYAALYDRVEGKDANIILQCYTDILPGRPTIEEHRAPEDDLRTPYDRATTDPMSKLHALTLLAAENQGRDYFASIGPLFADPVARMLYAEIASIEEQHVTQADAIIDPDETWIEKWLLHEAAEVYAYYSCLEGEPNTRLRAIWERFLAYELGQLHFVMDLFREIEKRDPAEVLPAALPAPLAIKNHRDFLRKTVATEAHLRASGPAFVDAEPPESPSIAYRRRMNERGSPSQIVAAGYRYQPGTELAGRLP